MIHYSEILDAAKESIRCHRENGTSLNPFSTNRSRSSWQNGFSGVPPSILDYMTEYHLGAVTAELLQSEPFEEK